MLVCIMQDSFGLITIKGQIIDSKSGNPLAFSHIVLINKTDTFYKKTNLEGEFQFNRILPDTYKILIKDFGYVPLDTTISLIATSQLNFSLINIARDSILLQFTNRKKAFRDIESKKIFLYLKGGGIFRESTLTNLDSAFENKFNLNYKIRGCSRFKEDNDSEYNHTIFEYLDKTYGKVWRKSVRKDIVGL
ncbi:MAG: carboxypeptidase regulatory-like domain-containing protein [Bacteroidetes bacterium]|nr:carboxypeptidase regulatory-like domain-containing protein [Bacteroidota bacterium]